MHGNHTIAIINIPGEHRHCTGHRRLDHCAPHSQADKVCARMCVCVQVLSSKKIDYTPPSPQITLPLKDGHPLQ